jgi:hypothetical protein
VYSLALGPEMTKLDPVKTSGSLPWLNRVNVRSSTLSLSTSMPGSAGASNRLEALTVASAPGLPRRFTVIAEPIAVPPLVTRWTDRLPLRGPMPPAANFTCSVIVLAGGGRATVPLVVKQLLP